MRLLVPFAAAGELAATGQSLGAIWWLLGAAAVILLIGAGLLFWRARANRHGNDQ